MNKILGLISLLVVFTLAPATAWSQLPALSYTSGAGAITDISGIVNNPGIGFQDIGNPCPATQEYGTNLGFSNPNLQPRSTGGDGVSKTTDSNTLNAGGRTETTSAWADATRGEARAFASGDVSSPCIVFPNGSIFMGAAGRAFAQFYDTFTVLSAPCA